MGNAVAPPPYDRTPWWHRTVSGLTLAACTVGCAGVCWLVSWLAMCVFVGGCATWGGAKHAQEVSTGWFSHLFSGSPGMGGPNYSIISIVASLLFVVGVVALVASFWLPLIPRRASVVCLIVSVGCWALQYVLDAYLGIAVLAVVIAAVVAAVPWVIGYVRLSIQKAGERLAVTDPRAGVALQAAVNPKVMKVRKTALTRYEAMRASKHTHNSAGSVPAGPENP